MVTKWLLISDIVLLLIGQVLSRQNIEDVIKFAKKEKLFILADEVSESWPRDFSESVQSMYVCMYVYMYIGPTHNKVMGHSISQGAELHSISQYEPCQYMHVQLHVCIDE